MNNSIDLAKLKKDMKPCPSICDECGHIVEDDSDLSQQNYDCQKCYGSGGIRIKLSRMTRMCFIELIKKMNTRPEPDYKSQAEQYKKTLQEIADYVFGNGLATMAASSILECFNRNGLHVTNIELGKTKITTILTQ